MFSQSQIENFISLTESTNSVNSIIELDSVNLKTFIVEMKIQIDRWDHIMSDLIFNPITKFQLLEELKGHFNNNKKLWGIEIHFNDFMPFNKVIGICNHAPLQSKKVVLGKLDLASIENMKRTYDLKAFW